MLRVEVKVGIQLSVKIILLRKMMLIPSVGLKQA